MNFCCKVKLSLEGVKTCLNRYLAFCKKLRACWCFLLRSAGCRDSARACNAMQNPQMTKVAPFLTNSTVQLVAKVMESSGDVVFTNWRSFSQSGLPSVWLTATVLRNRRYYRISCYECHDECSASSKRFDSKRRSWKSTVLYSKPSGIHDNARHTDMATGYSGVLLSVSWPLPCTTDSTQSSLPQYLGFFAGKRFVPIITSICALLLGLVMLFIWPPIQGALNSFSTNLLAANEAVAALIFGMIERALIPFGLHHIFYSPFWSSSSAIRIRREKLSAVTKEFSWRNQRRRRFDSGYIYDR